MYNTNINIKRKGTDKTSELELPPDAKYDQQALSSPITITMNSV